MKIRRGRARGDGNAANGVVARESVRTTPTRDEETARDGDSNAEATAVCAKNTLPGCDDRLAAPTTTILLSRSDRGCQHRLARGVATRRDTSEARAEVSTRANSSGLERHGGVGRRGRDVDVVSGATRGVVRFGFRFLARRRRRGCGDATAGTRTRPGTRSTVPPPRCSA